MIRARKLLLCSLLMAGLLIYCCSGQLSPVTCNESDHILLGVPFSLQDDFSMEDIERNCSFWATGRETEMQRGEDWTVEGFRYIFYTTGRFSYNCSDDDEMGKIISGSISIISAQYTISLCKDCRKQFHITAGEVVQWILVPKPESEQLGCTMTLQDEGDVEVIPAGVTQHQFHKVGTFRLSCQAEEIAALITVSEPVNSRPSILASSSDANNCSNSSISDQSHLLPLLYTHVALMAAAFGVLFPVAAFLHYHGVALAYKILLPVGIFLSLCGLVLVLVYVELAGKSHFYSPIHGVLGLALLLMAVVGMPLLLLHKKSRLYHFRMGHIVSFFGMGNVLLGLTILPATFAVAISLCAVYGLWLIAVVLGYIFYPAKAKNWKPGKEKTTVEGVSLKMSSRNGSSSNFCRESSTNDQTTSRGPQPLTKNIISDEKMVQLRRKSIDFFEAQRHIKDLNTELGIKHQLARALEEDEGLKVRMERKDSSKSDQEFASSDELDDSRAPLHQSSQEFNEDPFPSLDRAQIKQPSTSDDDDESYNEFMEKRAHSSSSVNRASTFNYGSRFNAVEAEAKANDSDTSERGGSLRITRHSKRARGKMQHIFEKPDLTLLLQEPTSPPSFNITPSTPPLSRCMMNRTPPPVLQAQMQESTDTGAITPPRSGRASPAQQRTRQTPAGAAGRRRRAGVVPPPLITTDKEPVIGQQPLLSNLEVRRGTKSPSPKPCRRNASPVGAGSSAGEDGVSPKPRKKKVSVAQIEATFVPPTPVTLEPPLGHPSLSRSPSFNTMRTHQDAFADNAFRSVMQISQDAIVCANNIGDIVFWSAGASKMFGYTPGEAVGSSLEMIIPQSYKEKHRRGITNRTENTLKYLRKHNYAPEEQKHARLYAVHGVTKGGHEFPVEVNVTSFVLDGEMFYTGVISELAKAKVSRNNSVSSSSDVNEVSLKQRALAVGAQMKIAHNLRSAEYISRKELERVLKGSLGTSFEVDSYQLEQMISGIMTAGDPDGTGAMTFVGLIQLLSQHQLYISESGLIARYGKTKAAENSSSQNQRHRQSRTNAVQHFLHRHMYSLMWLLLYVVLNLVLFAVGVGAHSRTDVTGLRLWARGTGPVLSMNCVLLLLPTLSSLVHAMRNSYWMNIIFPLKYPVLFHVAISCGLLFWTGVHLITHFSSFGLDAIYTSFGNGMMVNLFPTITGFLVLVIIAAMGISSIKPLRSRARFIPFKVLHWAGTVLFYLLLLVHGVHYWNPSFWKWLLPAVVIFALERVYRHGVIKKITVHVRSAGRYDSVSRTAIIELDKPRHFEYHPGQYLLLNLPKIGKFEWQPCQISSGPKEEKLTIHIPYSNDIWFKRAFEYLKQHPHNLPLPSTKGGGREKNIRLSQAEVEVEVEPASQLPAYFTGPYGPVEDMKQLFKYKISTVVCGGEGPHIAKSIIKKFLDYRKAINCHCGCQPVLSKLYFVWVIPTGNDFEWFTDYLSDLCEDKHLQHYLDIRVFLTNCDSAPDELASALLQLGLKTAGDKVTVRRPSQPQLNNLYHMTSYGVPDFTSLLQYIASHHSSLWMDKPAVEDFGVFSVGELTFTMRQDLMSAVGRSSKPGQLMFKTHKIDS